MNECTHGQVGVEVGTGQALPIGVCSLRGEAAHRARRARPHGGVGHIQCGRGALLASPAVG